MEFTNQFRVPSDIETTFATLTDLEKVAPCLPGATLEEVEGDTYRGKVKVKVGPVTVTYAGTARMAEADVEAKRGRIEASGKETRGTGTAKADVTASLVEDGEGTLVTVVTDLQVTGKPAQFGRGVMADVGARIIDTFADRLREMIEGPQEPAAEPTPSEPAPAAEDAPAPTAPAATAPATTGPRRIEPQPGREDDALDLMDVAGPAAIKRMVPLAVVALVVGALLWWWRRR